jgi:phytoene synthase
VGGTTLHTVDHARDITRRYARTFYFASHVLPESKRDAAYVVYAFCRYADNLTDVHGEDTERIPDAERQIARLREELDAVYGSADIPTRWVALRSVVRTYGIPRQYFDELLTGVAMDLTPRRFETWADLELYCYRVASVVGLIMTHIFGATTPAALGHATRLGTAMQLTNILRDIGEDLRMGRVYLPQEDLRAHGVTEEMLGAGTVTPAITALIQFQISRARALYADADPGIPMIPNDGSRFSTQLMRTLYSRILDAIEKNGYDVFSQRAHVRLAMKLRLAVPLLLRSLLGRTSRPVRAASCDSVVTHPDVHSLHRPEGGR